MRQSRVIALLDTRACVCVCKTSQIVYIGGINPLKAVYHVYLILLDTWNAPCQLTVVLGSVYTETKLSTTRRKTSRRLYPNARWYLFLSCSLLFKLG